MVQYILGVSLKLSSRSLSKDSCHTFLIECINSFFNFAFEDLPRVSLQIPLTNHSENLSEIHQGLLEKYTAKIIQDFMQRKIDSSGIPVNIPQDFHTQLIEIQLR